MKENGDKLDAAQKGQVESAIADLKKAMDGEDADKLKAAMSSFDQAFQAASAAMAGAGAPGGDAGQTAGAASGKGDDDIKDADFEVK